MEIRIPFPKIMGILNVTPDSFSDGGKFYDQNRAIEHALEMIEEGVDIIDIGGESSRPGAEEVCTSEELKRTIPVIEAIKKNKPEAVISIDTTKFEVAEAAVGTGASIINDISGLDFCPEFSDLAAKTGSTLILMHMKGTPRTMQYEPVYDDVVKEVFQSLKEKIEKAHAKGVKNIYADVGIGFGKKMVHNLELLKNHDKFTELGVPLALGISRKSFIGQLLGIKEPLERDFPTALIHAILINRKIDLIRVHNFKIFLQLQVLYNSIT